MWVNMRGVQTPMNAEIEVKLQIDPKRVEEEIENLIALYSPHKDSFKVVPVDIPPNLDIVIPPSSTFSQDMQFPGSMSFEVSLLIYACRRIRCLHCRGLSYEKS